MTRVAFFTKTFLEPTHHAIASVLRGLVGYHFIVFAKKFEFVDDFAIGTIGDRVPCGIDFTEDLRTRNCAWIHALFDGDIALRAAGAARMLGLPLILSFHGGFDTKSKIRDPLFRDLTRDAVQAAARVTVVSDADVRRLRAIGVTREIDVVRVPIDHRILPPARRTAHKLLAIGRLIEKKGFDVALRALTRLPEYELTVVGDGPMFSRWSALADEIGVAGRVRWLGMQPLEECLQLLSEAFALVHPARVGADGNAEGTPQAVLWAQAIGIPVICGDSGDLPEILHGGETGFGLDPASDDAFATAVRALKDAAVADAMIERAKKAAAAHSLDAVVTQWRAIYEDVERASYRLHISP